MKYEFLKFFLTAIFLFSTLIKNKVKNLCIPPKKYIFIFFSSWIVLKKSKEF